MNPDTATDFARYINILRSQGHGRASLERAQERGRGTSVTTLPVGRNLDLTIEKINIKPITLKFN